MSTAAGSTGHRPVIDCHSDVMMDLYRRRQAGERAVLVNRHLPGLRKGGIVAAVCTVGGDTKGQLPLGLDRAYESVCLLIDTLHQDAAESEGQVEVVASCSQLLDAISRGVFAVVPSVEGALAFQGELRLVEDLFRRGVRVVGLTWNSRNEFAVGVGSGEGGLTEVGAEAVRLMNDLGILIDLSHASPTTFWDVACMSPAPLFASHSNARSVWDHPRNLDDEQLSAIASSGGAVGVVFCPTFVAAHPATFDDVLKHLAYFREAVGPDAVVIGADFCDYAIEYMLPDIREHSELYDESTLFYPEGINSASCMQNLVRAMPGLGYEDRAVTKVATGNFVRVLDATERGAGS